LANGRLRSRYLANGNVLPIDTDKPLTLEQAGELQTRLTDPFYPRRWPEKLEQIRKRKKPAGIFLDDMSDWMGDYWPREWTEDELQVMRDCPQHRFYTLTKQPQNLIKFSPFPDNCWVGVTATNHDGFLGAINRLRAIEASVKYISFEPLLKEIPFKHQAFYYAGLSWVIIGAQTKPYKPPKIEWVEEIVRAADKAGIKVFLKNNLVPLLSASPNPDKAQLFYSEMGLRQELPHV